VPFLGEITGTWEPDQQERAASWELYVELVTRVSVVELGPAEGLLREALSSLYSLFETTRQILRKYGPEVAQPKGQSDLSFGYLAVALLNLVLRPTLAKWHPLLSEYESLRASAISTTEHEQDWSKNSELREDINKTRLMLMHYSNLLAEVAQVPSLIILPPKDQA
jgi:hypothetical protein